MRRYLKIAVVLLVVFGLLLSSVCGVYATSKSNNRFKDVNEKNYGWAYQAILDLADRGIISGYGDGSFKPDGTITRAEFATMLVKALDLKTTGDTQTFADVPPSNWAYKIVEAAKSYLTGWSVNGSLYFYGSRFAVREDMAVALVKALKLTVTSNNSQLQQVFSDYDSISPNLANYVYTAYVNGIMVGSNGKLNPQGNLTRAEAATLIERILQKVAVGDFDNGGQKVPVGDQPNIDATLSNLAVNGTTVKEFSSNKTSYNVVLPSGTTTVPTVTAAVNDTGKAVATVTQAPGLPGTATVRVVAEDGTTQKSYTINFTVAPPLHTDATLYKLSVNGNTITGFSPNTLTYNVVLPAGTKTVPTITAVVNDYGKANKYTTQAHDLPGTATVLVIAQDGATKNTYTVNFTVAPTLNSDATLRNLAVNGITVSEFSPNRFSYDVKLPAGTTTVPTVTAVVNDTGKATATVTQASGLPGTASVLVYAQNSSTQKVYTVHFTVASSMNSDATLHNLAVNGITVSGFSPNKSSYNLVLPAGTTTVPTVTAVVNDTGKATTTVTQASGLPGAATVLVIAQNGITAKIYTIYFTVAPSLGTDATLSSLVINGTVVSGFSADKTSYDVVLPAGTATVPTVTAYVHDSGKATATVTQASGLPGTATVLVIANDGVTQKVYTVHFTVAAPLGTDATLSSISINNTAISGFSASKTAYDVALPAGTATVYTLTAAVNDTGKATAVVTQASGLPGTATVLVTAQDSVTQKVYSVHFTVAPPSTDATLQNLAVSGTTVTGFAANTLSYDVVLPAGTTTVPTVTAAVNDTGKANATITQAPGLPGNATVQVTAQDGTTQKVYTIHFTVAAPLSTDATLSSLTINGTVVSGFIASKTAYDVVLPAGTATVPTVAAVVNDTGKATTVVTQAPALPGTASVVVTAQDGTTHKTYVINFTVSAS